MSLVLLYLTMTAMLVCGVVMITRRNPMHSAIWLVGVFVAMAASFVLMNAEFVAMIQLFIYAGGIMVLYIFVIMLVNLSESELRRPMFQPHTAAAVALAVAILAIFVMRVAPRFAGMTPAPAGTRLAIPAMAVRLFTDYLIPFEVASVLLLAALVGSIVLAQRCLRGEREPGKESAP